MSAHAPTPAIRHRFHLLDALRGIAALLVILVHAPAYVQQRLPPGNAFLAVDFFFCLSGFVLAHAYWRRLATDLTTLDFFRARLTRLLPIYLLAALLSLLWALTIDRRLFPHGLFTLSVLNLLLLPNLQPHLSPAMYPFNIPAWSLFFELLINIPFALLVRSRLSATRKLLLVALAMLLSLLALAHWISLGHLLGNLGWRSDPAALGNSLARVCLSFAAGIVLHAVFQHRAAHSARSTHRGTLLAIAVVVALCCIFLAPTPRLQTSGFQLLSIAFLLPALVYFGASCRLPNRLGEACAVAGEISYPLYLLQVPILRVFGAGHITAFTTSHPATIVPLFLLAMLLTVLLSYGASRLYDIPVRRRLSTRTNA